MFLHYLAPPVVNNVSFIYSFYPESASYPEAASEQTADQRLLCQHFSTLVELHSD